MMPKLSDLSFSQYFSPIEKQVLFILLFSAGLKNLSHLQAHFVACVPFSKPAPPLPTVYFRALIGSFYNRIAT